MLFLIDCVISSQLLASDFCEILHSIEDNLRFNLVSGKLISSASHVNRLTFVLICENDFPRVNLRRKTAKEENRGESHCIFLFNSSSVVNFSLLRRVEGLDERNIIIHV